MKRMIINGKGMKEELNEMGRKVLGVKRSGNSPYKKTGNVVKTWEKRMVMK